MIRLPAFPAALQRPAWAILAAMWCFAGCGQQTAPDHGGIDVLCAAALRVPVEEAARAYESEGRGKVWLQFGGSQTMLSSLKISREGDIFLPADLSYVELAGNQGLVGGAVALAEMKAVIAVARGNPRNLQHLADLQRPGLRVVLAHPELAAISQLTAQALPAATWQALTAHAVAMKPTVNDVAHDIALGAADAGIVWNTTVLQTQGLEVLAVPELAAVKGKAAGAVALTSRRPDAARRFLRWLAAPEKGGAIFCKHGYDAAPDGTAAGSGAKAAGARPE